MSSATSPAPTTTGYRGSAKLLTGIVLGVLTFWLFAGSMGTVAPNVLADINAGAEHISASAMNMAVSITALFSGLFIVLMGGLADKVGRLRVAIAGNVLGIVGSLFVVVAAGDLALPLMLTGRVIQGLSAACIMPSTMALLRAYWDGADRQRAVSMWSIGSWGGSGLSALCGGIIATTLNWRYIFVLSIVVSVIAIVLMLGAPESKVESTVRKKFDVPGLVAFMAMTLAFMIVVIFGRQIGWGSPVIWILAVVGVVAAVVFVTLEKRNSDNPFIDFALFRNKTFSGATLSNFLLNCTIGLLMVSQQLFQMSDKGYTPLKASVLTIGYAVFIIGLIRVGEKLLRAYGPRKPMIWGTLIVALSAILLIPTNLLVGQYQVLAIIAYCLFGIGLAFYATPSTDAALSNLPADQTGAGSGIYKMASSLGSAVGAAVSLTIFSSMAGSGASWLGTVLATQGTLDNQGVRQAASVAMIFNLVLTLVALASILITVPKGTKYNDD
ncbi:MFS transporter [Cellulomonas denverensis]|uniref:MFS transporter n=1 Tax=Cellulomonas denverensis TaxID=264297 RepID=A0A7X6KUT7_9CELL|nr:MFS transporter [Cellulomonas denverensis]NKY22707.1 MFS transporter [Cellulomonas denverensis]